MEVFHNLPIRRKAIVLNIRRKLQNLKRISVYEDSNVYEF